MVKIGAELPKLSQNKTEYPFFGPPCKLNSDQLIAFGWTAVLYRGRRWLVIHVRPTGQLQWRHSHTQCLRNSLVQI